jgi:NAD(P)-dependent dehydrogenase (short-subunit alcohol dehydrogenase family)
LQHNNISGTPVLTGQVVVVSGATGEIGVEYTTAFVRAGAKVIATDLAVTGEAGDRLAEMATAKGPGEAVFVPGDVTSDADVCRVVATARKRFGRLDALVNNAAIYRTAGLKRPLTELRNEEWDRMLTVNVRGTWQMIKAAVPAMQDSGGGRIVNIASTVARSGAPGFAHYVASKAAVEGLTRAAARELGEFGITVNAVAPGLVDDEASRDLNTAEYLGQAAKARAIARGMDPSDLVGAVLWLSSPASGFVSGQTVVVDGGQVFV